MPGATVYGHDPIGEGAMSEVISYGLGQFCEEMERLVSQEKDNAIFFEEAQVLLKKLLPNREFVNHVLERMVSDDAFLRSKIGTIDNNDMILYLSPKGSFSVRLFVWLPSVEYPIHDHGSWGVVGGYANKIREVKYRRLDDGSIEGYARVEETTGTVISLGDTVYVEPFGLHQMDSLEDQTALSVHVYGKPLRRGFVQCFNCQDNSHYNLIAPALEKRLFAVRALGTIGGDMAKNHIEKAFHDSHPLVRLESIMAMEKVDKDSWLALLEEAVNDVSQEVKKKARAAISQM